MNTNQNSQNMEEFKVDESLSIDDFIKELEEKEKDLNIFSEMVIEVDENDLEDLSISDFSRIQTASENADKNLVSSLKNHIGDEGETQNLKNEIALLQLQVSKMETQRTEMVEVSRRRHADFENYKNRTERERSETFRKQLGNLAEQILPVLDNLNRALDSAVQFSDEKLKDFQQFFDGIVLVNQQLNEVLGGMGIQPIPTVGEIFDPHFHEAVATEENKDFPPNTITTELLRGYRIDDKVIRPAMVKVSARKRES